MLTTFTRVGAIILVVSLLFAATTTPSSITLSSSTTKFSSLETPCTRVISLLTVLYPTPETSRMKLPSGRCSSR